VLNVSLREVSRDALINLPSGNYLQLRVADTGCGISPEIQDKIFDPYFTTKQKGKGTGLGLAVVQGIIAECGGKISIDSQPGKGTTIDVYLPQVAKTAVAHKPAVPVLPTGSEHILLVDDEPALVNIGRQMLEKLGYTVTTRSSSMEAVALFSAKPDAFDLVITDMTMPNMTGDRLARELLTLRPEIPVILCTGFSEQMTAARAAEIGIKGFLMKPLDRTTLAETVRQLLDKA